MTESPQVGEGYLRKVRVSKEGGGYLRKVRGI